jgi:hypothetical protein
MNKNIQVTRSQETVRGQVQTDPRTPEQFFYGILDFFAKLIKPQRLLLKVWHMYIHT